MNMQEEGKRPPSSQSNKSVRSNRSGQVRKSLRDVINAVNSPTKETNINAQAMPPSG